MNQEQSKKEFECRCVGLLLEANPLLNGYSIESAEKDPPDVIITQPGSRVGIEVTRLYSDITPNGGSKSRQHRGLQEFAAEYTQEILRKKVSEAWHINIHFNPSLKKKPGEIVRQMAESLAETIYLSILKEDKYIELRPEDYDYDESILPYEVDFVHGIRVPAHPDNLELVCFSSWSGWVGETTYNLIQEGLNSKEKQLQKFTGKFDECWILLVCDNSSESSMLRLHKSISKEVYTSSFNQAFILDMHAEHYQLKLRTQTPTYFARTIS
jgi:hypothetical protein